MLRLIGISSDLQLGIIKNNNLIWSWGSCFRYPSTGVINYRIQRRLDLTLWRQCRAWQLRHPYLDLWGGGVVRAGMGCSLPIARPYRNKETCFVTRWWRKTCQVLNGYRAEGWQHHNFPASGSVREATPITSAAPKYVSGLSCGSRSIWRGAGRYMFIRGESRGGGLGGKEYPPRERGSRGPLLENY